MQRYFDRGMVIPVERLLITFFIFGSCSTFLLMQKRLLVETPTRRKRTTLMTFIFRAGSIFSFRANTGIELLILNGASQASQIELLPLVT
jgi:hypothetical protein